MVVEILAIMIRKNKKIQGISINNNVCKLNQYADDTCICTLNIDESVLEIFKLIQKFSTISGLTLNEDKTEVLHIGTKPCSKLIDKTWLKQEINLLGVKISLNTNMIINSNYNNKLSKIDNCLKIWKMRDLSLLGKIHIIKSLASSQLVYNWSTLPKPPDQFFKDLDSKLYNFMWNSKIDRVKRATMIAPYHEGGLNMIDSRTQCKSLKLKWIKQIKEQYHKKQQDFWFIWLQQCLPKMDILDFLKCNLSTSDLNYICKWQENSFWQEVFSVWCDLNYNPHSQQKAIILNQPIWHNSLMKIGRKTIFRMNWYNKKVITIEDLIVGNRWMTTEELNIRYEIKTNFLELRSMLNCMPNYWKYIIFDEDDSEFKGYNIEIMSFVCKDMYHELLKTKVHIPEQYVIMWGKLLDTDIDEIDWYNSYTDCFAWTISTKLRSFYYQLRVGDIMTNKKLVKMKIKEDPNCTWCTNNTQDLLHLFWECTKVNYLWIYLSKWISSCIGCHLEIKKELIFLHDIDAGNYTTIINLIILITTRYIYVCKCLDHLPTFQGLLKKVSEIEYLERKISIQKGKLYYHNKKWRQISHHI